MSLDVLKPVAGLASSTRWRRTQFVQPLPQQRCPTPDETPDFRCVRHAVRFHQYATRLLSHFMVNSPGEDRIRNRIPDLENQRCLTDRTQVDVDASGPEANRVKSP